MNSHETTPGPPPLGVAMIGYAFMGKAHSNALKKIAYMTWPPPLMPQLVAIAGRNEAAVSEAARRYGFDEYVTDWKALVADGIARPQFDCGRATWQARDLREAARRLARGV